MLMRPVRVINDVIKRYPLATSMAVTCSKAGAADFLVQRFIERREDLDRRRLATFFAFGFFYQGGFQYFLFNRVFERWFPGQSFRAIVQKIVTTNLIADPVFFFPTFYTIKEGLGRDPKEAFSFDTVTTALRNYYGNCFNDWRNTWSFWLPGHCITYGLCPIHLRMPWVALSSFGYVALLSFTRGGATVKAEVQQRAAVDPA